MDEKQSRKERADMSDDKRFKTEWSFSFDKLNQDIGEFVKSLGVGNEETVKQGEFSAPLDGATSAKVRLDLTVGKTYVKSASNVDRLIDADLTYVGDINFLVTGEAEKQVSLSQKAEAANWIRNVVGWLGSKGALRWDVGLANGLPMALEVHGGVGEAHFNLSELELTDLALYCGAGEFEVILAQKPELYAARITAGVGEVNVTVPAGASVDLMLKNGAGEMSLEVGSGVAMTATIEGGVGECNIHLPMGAAVSIEAQSGVGEFKFPREFARVSGSDEFLGKRGIWQTPNFESAERKIAIRYNGGVGELDVRFGHDD
jgi:hypothetical protein